MSKKSDDDPARASHDSLKAFLDCVAQLMARRWVREQRQRTTQHSNPHEAILAEVLNPGDPSRSKDQQDIARKNRE